MANDKPRLSVKAGATVVDIEDRCSAWGSAKVIQANTMLPNLDSKPLLTPERTVKIDRKRASVAAQQQNREQITFSRQSVCYRQPSDLNAKKQKQKKADPLTNK
jgi:hypothetical protein